MSENVNELSFESLSADPEIPEVIDQPILTSIIPGRSGKGGLSTLRFEWFHNQRFSAGKVFNF